MSEQPIVVRGKLHETARTALGIATRGLPAIRAALHGARLGAGIAFGSSVIERLGVKVVRDLPETASLASRAMTVHGKDGISLRLTALGGAAVTVSESTVQAVARGTARTALTGIGRAARQGALAGAAVDGLLGVVEGVRGLQSGKLTRGQAAWLAGKRAARGAVSGAGGVAAAGAASAVLAATGISIAGAPIVVPIVVMTAAGLAISRGFDKAFGA
jgi:hypothetical protein